MSSEADMVSVFQAILLNSLNMSLVALLLMVILSALKNRQSPRIRYYSWLIVLIGFLIPVRFTFGKALFHFPGGSSSAPVTAGTISHPVEAASSGISFHTVLCVLFVVYLLGAVGFLAVSFIRFLRWKRTVLRLSRSYAVSDAFLKPIAEEMGVSEARLVLTDAVSSPMMIGLLTPTILLPVRKYDYDELRLIVKHELTHFQHKDLWIKFLLIVCRAIHWFNPLMILFGRSIEKECEYYCDMAVMEVEPKSMRKVYCQSILNTLADQVQRKNSSFRPVLATSFYSPKTGLKHRFSMVLSGKKRTVAGILVLAVLLTAVSGFAISTAATDEEPSKAISEVSETEGADAEVTEAEGTDAEVTVAPLPSESVEGSETEEDTFLEPTESLTYASENEPYTSESAPDDPESATYASESEPWTDETKIFASDASYETYISESYAPTSSVAET